MFFFSRWRRAYQILTSAVFFFTVSTDFNHRFFLRERKSVEYGGRSSRVCVCRPNHFTDSNDMKQASWWRMKPFIHSSQTKPFPPPLNLPYIFVRTSPLLTVKLYNKSPLPKWRHWHKNHNEPGFEFWWAL